MSNVREQILEIYALQIMEYVNRVRYYIYKEKMKLNEAVEHAVTECIQEGILERFLKENRAEVIAMSIFEFDEEKEWKLIREAEYQYGMEVGLERGRNEGIETIIEKLLKKNFSSKEVADMLEVDIQQVSSVLERISEEECK